MAGYTNLPGIHPVFEDGNLSISATSNTPVVLVIGTATKGDASYVYEAPTVAHAVARFGRTDGTLIRGALEADGGGAKRIKLLRIGAKPAKLTGVGSGITIETIEMDDNAGNNVKLYFNDTTGRLRIWRTLDDLLVYDNNPAYPTGAVDEYVVSVTGTWTTGSGNIGSEATPCLLASSTVGVYTAGTDGIQLSRMQLFEALYDAYIAVENEELSVVVPRDVYLDDLNLCDMTTAEVSALQASAPWSVPTTYPTRGTKYDVLGKVYVSEYQGTNYFWWDMNNDGVAELYPSGTGSASSNRNCAGDVITASDYHEANFGYQLANFCYTTTENEISVRGVIGVKPPVSWAPKHVSNWIGKEPTYSEDSGGNLVISSSAYNGTGLLGIKWVAGRKASVAGPPGLIIGTTDGYAYGGFIATDTGWPDGTQLEDDNEHRVDIGKYLVLTAAYAIMANSTSTSSYMANISSMYAGFLSSLPSNEAATNRIFEGVRMPFRTRNSKLDSLAGMRYTMLKVARKGIVVADAPTAARPDSDYQRQLTVAIVNEVIEAVRAKVDPFIGKGVLSGAKSVALETAIDSALASFVPSRLERYEKVLSFTREQKIRGEATLKLKLIPVSELRELTIEVSLAAS